MRFTYLTTEFFANAYAETGSEQLLAKDDRPYLGVLDESGWFIPLRSNLSKKSSDKSKYLTVFSTNNTHFKRPGLDFQKAVFVRNQNMVGDEIVSLPKKQKQIIENNFAEIENKFVEYINWVQELPDYSNEKKFATPLLFPKGMEKIKNIQVEKSALDLDTNNKDRANNISEAWWKIVNSKDSDQPLKTMNIWDDKTQRGIQVGYADYLQPRSTKTLYADNVGLTARPYSFDMGGRFLDEFKHFDGTSMPAYDYLKFDNADDIVAIVDSINANYPSYDQAQKHQLKGELLDRVEKFIADEYREHLGDLSKFDDEFVDNESDIASINLGTEEAPHEIQLLVWKNDDEHGSQYLSLYEVNESNQPNILIDEGSHEFFSGLNANTGLNDILTHFDAEIYGLSMNHDNFGPSRGDISVDKEIGL